jgi:hypothetical protein
MAQFSLIEIIDVSLMFNLDMPALRAVNVSGLGRRFLLCHNISSFFWLLLVARTPNRWTF